MTQGRARRGGNTSAVWAGSAVRRIRELHGVGQEVLSERRPQKVILSRSKAAHGRITRCPCRIGEPSASSLGIGQAGVQVDQVERFSEDERRWSIPTCTGFGAAETMLRWRR